MIGEFKENFCYENIAKLSEKLDNLDLDSVSQEDIDNVYSELASILIEPAKLTDLTKPVHNKYCSKETLNSNKSWFSNEWNKTV